WSLWKVVSLCSVLVARSALKLLRARHSITLMPLLSASLVPMFLHPTPPTLRTSPSPTLPLWS
ncbi:hypothetical protein H0H93_006406, partial [Arthromyces matolae]